MCRRWYLNAADKVCWLRKLTQLHCLNVQDTGSNLYLSKVNVLIILICINILYLRKDLCCHIGNSYQSFIILLFFIFHGDCCTWSANFIKAKSWVQWFLTGLCNLRYCHRSSFRYVFIWGGQNETLNNKLILSFTVPVSIIKWPTLLGKCSWAYKLWCMWTGESQGLEMFCF